jgi:hypothetical protein
VSLSENLLCPRPRFLKRAPYTCEPLRCKTYDPEQVVALHRVNKLVSECVWGGCTLLLTINHSTIVNLPTSQITRTRYPFPGNGFITGTITSFQYGVSYHFLFSHLGMPTLQNTIQFSNVNSLIQFSSGYCSVLLQLPASQFASLITTLHTLNGKRSLYF